MKILVVGGGSGGHITPAVAVVREIQKEKPRARIEFWTDPKYYKNVTRLTTEIGVPWGENAKSSHRSSYIRVRRLPAGKLYRYSNWSSVKDFFTHLDLVIKDLIFGNIIGFFSFLAGLLVSFFRLFSKKNRPNIVFLKGGYVCLPIGLIARLFKIPYIVHESDAVAGLANRILMKKAKKVAFGTSPSEETLKSHPNYIWTGIPVSPEFRPVSPTKQISFKKAFSFSPDKPLVVITGGSQGSLNLNDITRIILPELLKFTSVGLVAGRRHYENMIDLKKYENWEKAALDSNFRMWEFNTTMSELMGAADVIVSRAGATTIAEMAALKKATILVPYEALPGGHQVKNADRLGNSGAASVIYDSEMVKRPQKLLEEIRHLIKSPSLRAKMAERLHDEAKSDAATHLARIIIEEAN